jgi:hypothetical protein
MAGKHKFKWARFLVAAFFMGAFINCDRGPEGASADERSYIYIAGSEQPSGDILRLDAKTGRSSIAAPLTVKCIAADVDLETGDLFIYTAGHLRRRTPSGRIVLDIPINTKTASGHEYLAYNNNSREICLFNGEGTLLVYDAVGGTKTYETAINLANASQFLLDDANSYAWVVSADRHKVERRNARSGPGVIMRLTTDGQFYRLSNDPHTDSVVIGLTEDGRNYLYRVYNNYQDPVKYEITVKPAYVCVEPLWANIWVSDGTAIKRFDPDGKGLRGISQLNFIMGDFDNNGSAFFGLTAAGQAFAVSSSTLNCLWTGPNYGAGNDINFFEYSPK